MKTETGVGFKIFKPVAPVQDKPKSSYSYDVEIEDGEMVESLNAQDPYREFGFSDSGQ